MTTYYTIIDSPVGLLLLTSDAEALTGIHFEPENGSHSIDPLWVRDDCAAPLPLARAQLAEYFRGERQEFVVPLRPVGTEFQRMVWDELTRIPYGATISYGTLASRVGNPNASRAVGLANGRNPLAIIVPCHRVIGANGHLTGYGGGMTRKETLLALERRGRGAEGAETRQLNLTLA